MSRIRGRQAQAEAAANVRPTRAPSLRRASRTTLGLALVVPLTLAFMAVGTTSGFAITRDGVLARAQKWIDSPVRYSQARRHLGYRTDCSGYVSMCWQTGTSWSTRSFHTVSHRIQASQLKPGDALLKKGYHIRLFYGWVDDAHTEYAAYESGSGKVAVCRIHSIADDLAFGYVPTRYDRVSNSPAKTNILKNGSFNTWARSWGGRPDQPVWWQTSGTWWQTPVTRRKDTYRSARNSLKLINPGSDPAAYTELSQSVPIIPGVDYRLSAWAKTDLDPRGVELRLVYLNATGDPVAETHTTGDGSGLNGSAFKRMSLLYAAPADAVRALVSVRLAGGGTADASGTVVPGTWVILDDVSLTRP